MKVLIGIVSLVVLMATCHATPLGSKRVCHVRPTYEFEYELSQAIKRKISGPPTFEELDTDTEDGKVVIDEFTEFNGKISKEFQASYSELKGKVDDHKAEVEKVVFKLFQQADVDDDKAYLDVEEFETFVGYFRKVKEIQDVDFEDIDKEDDCMVSFAEIKPKFVDEPVENYLTEINSITAKAEEDKAITEADLKDVFYNMDSNCDGSLDNAEYAVYTGPSSSIDPPVCSVLPTYKFKYALSQAIEIKISERTPTFEELDSAPINEAVTEYEFTKFIGKISDEFQASYNELMGELANHRLEVGNVVQKLFEQAVVDDDKSHLDEEEFETFVGYFSKVEEIQDVGFGDIVKADDCMVSFAEIKPKFVDEPVEQHLAEINSITAKAEEDKAITEDDLYEVFSNLNINCDESLDKDEYALYNGPTTTELDPPECKLTFDEDGKSNKENVKKVLVAALGVAKAKNEELKEIQVDEIASLEKSVQEIFDAANTEDDDDKLNEAEFKVFQARVTDEELNLDSVDGNKDGKIDWEEAKKQFVDKVAQDTLDSVKFDEEKFLEELAGFDEKYAGVEKIDGKEADKLTSIYGNYLKSEDDTKSDDRGGKDQS